MKRSREFAHGSLVAPLFCHSIVASAAKLEHNFEHKLKEVSQHER